jgi:hypothetical protein
MGEKPRCVKSSAEVGDELFDVDRLGLDQGAPKRPTRPGNWSALLRTMILHPVRGAGAGRVSDGGEDEGSGSVGSRPDS